MADNFDDFPYNYDPHGFIVAATKPLQPRAGAQPMQNPLMMQRGNLTGGPAYQALMQALSGSFPRAGVPSIQQRIAAMTGNNAVQPYTPQGIPQAQRINWAPQNPDQPGTVQPMTQPEQPASVPLPPWAGTGLTE